VRFAFTADQAGASFECKVDHEAYDACTSPLSRKVTKGKHTFSVRATSATGKTGDAAVYAFKVKVKRHHHHHH
jgi:hypothetical protein